MHDLLVEFMHFFCHFWLVGTNIWLASTNITGSCSKSTKSSEN